jgi:hypothetical protein
MFQRRILKCISLLMNENDRRWHPTHRMAIYCYGSYWFHDTKDQNGTHHSKVFLNFIKVFKSDFSTSCDSSSHWTLTCSRYDIPEALLWRESWGVSFRTFKSEKQKIKVFRVQTPLITSWFRENICLNATNSVGKCLFKWSIVVWKDSKVYGGI